MHQRSSPIPGEESQTDDVTRSWASGADRPVGSGAGRASDYFPGFTWRTADRERIPPGVRTCSSLARDLSSFFGIFYPLSTVSIVGPDYHKPAPHDVPSTISPQPPGQHLQFLPHGATGSPYSLAGDGLQFHHHAPGQRST